MKISFLLLLVLLIFTDQVYTQRISMNSPGTQYFNVYKGQKNISYGYTIFNLEDIDGDGIARATNHVMFGDHINKKIASVRKDFQADIELSPPQGNFNRSAYIDATNLSVGQTYQIIAASISEPPVLLGGGIGVRAAVAVYAYVTIIPYNIPITEKTAFGGTDAKATIRWQRPSPLYWNIKYYSIFRRSDDSVKINQLSSCEKFRTNIPSNQYTAEISDAPRSTNSFYAVVAYDSLGEAVGISRSFQLTKNTSTFSLLSLTDNQISKSLTPTLDWQDYGTNNFTLWISEDSTFITKTEITDIAGSGYTFTNQLNDHKTYYWKVKETNGDWCNETGWRFKTNITNQSPNSFELQIPLNFATVSSRVPILQWQESIDEGDIISYNLLIATDNTFNNIILDKTTRAPYFNLVDSLTDNAQYYWKVKAIDSEGLNVWSSESFSFLVNQNDYPSKFTLVFPRWNYNQLNVNELPLETNLTPTFQWTASTDNDPSSSISYTLWYGQDSTFASKTEVTGISDTSYQVTSPLEEDKIYYWRVFASDNTGLATTHYGLPYAFVTNSVDRDPSSPTLLTPSENNQVAPDNIILSWSTPDDDIYDQHKYRLIISSNPNFTDTTLTVYPIYSNSYNINWIRKGIYYWKVLCFSKTITNVLSGSSTSVTSSFDVDYNLQTFNLPEGSNYMINSLKTLTWTANDVLRFNLYISYDQGNNWSSITSNLTSTSYNFTVPNIEATNVLFKIENYDDVTDYLISGPKAFYQADLDLVPFSISGELYAGDDLTIRWTSTNVENILIESNIGQVTPSISAISGEYIWTIPNYPTNSLVITIRDLQNTQYNYSSIDLNIPVKQNFTTSSSSFNALRAGQVLVGDIDNDDDLDIFHTGILPEKTYLYKNNLGNLTSEEISIHGLGFGVSTFHDYNNDNNLDLLLIGDDNYSAHGTTLLYKCENNNFVLTQGFQSISDGTPKFGDINNDGLQDFVLSGYDWPPFDTGNRVGILKFYENQNYALVDKSDYHTISFSGKEIDFGDFDKDGDNDLLTKTKLYVNNNGVFNERVTTFQEAMYWCDIDSDGDLDVVAKNNFYINDDNDFDRTIYFEKSITGILDYNNDGWMDAIHVVEDQWKIYLTKVINYNNIRTFFLFDTSSNPSWSKVVSADINNDGRIDFVHFCNYSSTLYLNDYCIANTPPTVPSNLRTESSTPNSVRFSWNHATDSQTPWHGLTYNLRISTTSGGTNILSPMSNPTNGFRKIPQMGNVQCDTSWIIKNLPAGTYYWSVQAIDNGYMGGMFAEEQSFTIDINGALPVELTKFDAVLNNGKVEMKWETATEVNNYGFNIERRIQNEEWIKIGFIQGNGNSNSPKYYSFTDSNLPSGKINYRLKQIDFDGKYDYSKIVEILVDLPAVYKLTQNYPNPFNPTTTIEYGLPKSSLVIIKVYDVLGNEVATLVNQEKPAGNFEVKFDGSKLTSGIYFYQIKAGSFIETKKFILMK